MKAAPLIFMAVCFVLLVLLLALGLVENAQHRKNLRKVPVRILVNGTRGKTTVARILISSMNQAGIRTLGRTTGSQSQYIYPDGHVEPFVRRRKARILEMIQVFRLAGELGVDAVVVECMALNPENQKTIATSLVRPTHVVITNTFIDHVAEMGPTVEETAQALSQSVPRDCNLYVTEPWYDDLPCKVHRISEAGDSIPDFPIPVHPSNYAVAKAVLSDLGVSEASIAAAAGTILPDVGLLGDIVLDGGAVLVPTFSVNDLTCMTGTVREKISCYPGRRVFLVFNNRQDREYRIQLMDEVLRSCRDSIEAVITIGDYTWKVSRHFARIMGKAGSEALDVETLYSRLSAAGPDELYIGLGNIKGKAEELIERFKEDF